WVVDCRSRLSRASNFGNRDSHRLDWCARLLLLAEVRCDGNKSISQLRREIFLYACKIKETTNGGRRGARSEARSTLQVVAQRRFTRNVQVDEQSGAAQNGQNQAQRQADEEEAALRIFAEAWTCTGVLIPFALLPSPLSKVPRSPCLSL